MLGTDDLETDRQPALVKPAQTVPAGERVMLNG